MRQLSPAGLQAVSALARRHGFGDDATVSMLDAIVNGNGSMAQFNHPDFGGAGQWMRGGLIMISDMFNNQLKGRIDGLCHDLAGLVADQPDLIRTGSFQSQSQGGYTPATSQQPSYGGSQQQDSNGPVGPVSLFVPPPAGSSGDWWPGDIGWPSSTGAQNNVRYAYFREARRLAIDVNGAVMVYDTLDHQIGGFSQQQSLGGSLSFSSQYGLVNVASLPVISSNGVPQRLAPPAESRDGDIFATLEKLAALRDKGIVTEDEFAAKKAELLSRL